MRARTQTPPKVPPWLQVKGLRSCVFDDRRSKALSVLVVILLRELFAEAHIEDAHEYTGLHVRLRLLDVEHSHPTHFLRSLDGTTRPFVKRDNIGLEVN